MQLAEDESTLIRNCTGTELNGVVDDVELKSSICKAAAYQLPAE